MRWLIIGSSLLLGCDPSTTRTDPTNLGPFDSNVIKISWLRLVPMMVPDGKKIQSLEPQYSVIYSEGWMREYGARSREPYLKGLRGLIVSQGQGIDNDRCRRFVSSILGGGFMEIPEVDPKTLTAAETAARYKQVRENMASTDWLKFRFITIETDKIKRVVARPPMEADPKLLAIDRRVENVVGQIMGSNTIRIDIRINPGDDD